MSAMNALNALCATRARRRVLTGVLTGVPAVVLTGALAGALAGCGIAPTDVIDAGEPATGVRSPGQPEAEVQLFFYGPSGLRSATRRAETPVGPEQAIEVLMKGPNHAERMRGLSSVLPKFPGPLTAATRVGSVVITLPMDVKLLDSASLNQLVCTAANARVPGNKPPGEVTVTLVSKSVRVGPMVCGGNNAFPVVEPSPTRTAPPAPTRTATGGTDAGPTGVEPGPTG
ncbi:GerMN domain-containing protein [Streptomyces sp. NRRL S-1813]|uniref:GerMN domain-containing protein n=1 Tax=Streptomyces sp. NRRL S-1813 TaxID=1463888 RepID=UPI0004CC11FD|nr:GerMN domain-containing protein [Streptomyces sp. NRRL S-1813]